MNRFRQISLIRLSYSKRKSIGHPLHNPPPLALKYVQSLLKLRAGYKTNVHIIDALFDDLDPSDLLTRIISNHPGLLVLEISPAASRSSLEIARAIKKEMPAAIIVAVGADVSERYQHYVSLDSIFDITIRGEYEMEVCSLVNELNHTHDVAYVKNLYQQKKIQTTFTIDPLDDLPQTEWSYAESRKYIYRYPLRMYKKIVSGYICTSRGCRHGCTFCSPSVRKSFGKKLRTRDIYKVVDEIEYLQELGVNIISIEDDDFTGNQDHVSAICNEICRRKININWTCHARVDEVDEDLLALMRKAGCILILFGIESGSKKIIRILRKASLRVDWNNCAMRAFAQCRNVGIATCAMFLVGNPQETLNDVNKSMNLALMLKPDFIKVHNFTLYPGSIEYDKYRDQTKNIELQHHYDRPTINVSKMSRNDLQRIQKDFYKRFMFRPSFILSHLYHYLLFYLLNFRWSFALIKDVLMFLFISDRFHKTSNDTTEPQQGGTL